LLGKISLQSKAKAEKCSRSAEEQTSDKKKNGTEGKPLQYTILALFNAYVV